MKLGEIKIEALKLMFVNDNKDLVISELATLGFDENYGRYLVNMTGAINRCFSSIEEKGVLPIKTSTLKASNGVASGVFTRFNLSALINDFFDIDRIVCECNGEYIGDYEYQREGNNIVIKDFDLEDMYKVLYHPAISRITALTSNDINIDIPDNIASYIAYFVKGELYRDDEPNEASEARNWYEFAMDAIINTKTNKTNKVANIYSQTEI